MLPRCMRDICESPLPRFGGRVVDTPAMPFFHPVASLLYPAEGHFLIGVKCLWAVKCGEQA